MSKTFRTGDKVRVIQAKQVIGGVAPEGAEGVVTDEMDGYYLYVSLPGHYNTYDGFLMDERHRNTFPLTADEVEAA